MSIVALSEAWLYSQARGGTLLVLLAIADTADRDSGVSWPHEETLAVRARLSTRQVQRAIQELQTLGELDVWEYIRHGKRKNAYRVLVGEFASYRGRPVDEIIKKETGGQVRRRKLPQALRNKILERDGFRCQECGISRDLAIDHIHPVSKGGTDEESNLQVLCRPCNSRKRDKVSAHEATSTSRQEPSVEIEKPHRTKSLVCSKCGLGFKTQAKLDDHLRNVEGEDVPLKEEAA